MLHRPSLFKRILSRRARRQARMAWVARQSYPASPIVEIPFPAVDVSAAACIDAILAAPEFRAASRFFSESPSVKRALVSADSQALFYALLRNMRPDHVVEIGTYRASTTEAMARALHANGCGLVHTVEPVVAEWVPHILAQWPQTLRERVRFYPMTSAAFFNDCQLRPGFVFIDGNHEFEYALFDMLAAARIIKPGGLVAIDNISQPGPFFAARRFCRDNPEWSEIGSSLANYRDGYPFDKHRATIVGTDCCMLRAPRHFSLDSQPVGQAPVLMKELREIAVTPIGEPQGALQVQCILRTFCDPPVETTVERELAVAGVGRQVLRFDPPLRPVVEAAPFTVEVWLAWTGAGRLLLEDVPAIAERRRPGEPP